MVVLAKNANAALILLPNDQYWIIDTYFNASRLTRFITMEDVKNHTSEKMCALREFEKLHGKATLGE